MAVNVVIKEKGLFSKRHDIKEFIFEDMGYGIADEAFRLIEGQTGNITIVYHKEKVERGIELSLENGKVHLRMSLPTGENEIIFFYDYVKKICELLNTTTFEREEEKSTFEDIPKYIELDKNASVQALKDMEEKLRDGTYSSMFLYAVYNPITIGTKELSTFKQDIKELGVFLEEKQSIDAYYSSPRVYQRPNDTYFGIYTITEEVLSIFPLETNLNVNGTKVEDVYMAFIFEEEMKGVIKYSDFLSNTDVNNFYDSNHFLISLKKKEMRSLLEKYKVEI